MILYINYNIKKKKMSFLSGLSNDTWSSRNGDEGGNFWTLKGVQPSIHPDLVKALEEEPMPIFYNDLVPQKALPLDQALPPVANAESQKVISNYNFRPYPQKKKQF